MKITVTVKSRFHAFDLAKCLEKKGFLNRLVTTYPYFKVKEWGIKKSHCKNFVLLEIINRFFKNGKHIDEFVTYLFDKKCAMLNFKNDDIVVCFSTFAFFTFQKAKKQNCITVLERGSCHVLEQKRILEEEFKLYDKQFYAMNEKLIEKELKEYEIADYISVPSSFAKRTFLERGFSNSKILVNPYGVDIEAFYKIDKKDDVFRIIHCGQISLQKGVQYLIEAFEKLDIENSELWLIGSVSVEFESIISNLKNSKIILKGTFPQSELYKLYSQGSVFCLNSIQDGFGMVISQAMACELPVICTENTAGIDIVEDGQTGFVIPIRDSNILSEKLKYLYDNPEVCLAMGKKAQNKIKNGFYWEDYGERTIAMYKEILRKNG